MLPNDASVLIDLIEAGTESNWPHVSQAVLDKGWTPKEIAAAVARLCKIAHRSPIIEESDF